ncbi:MAG TPA: UV DNA damage repair endonuclease UvsE [Elusimicrobia bacterium]|nr:MAG: UV damage repair endonuclease UvsE [Elusimicrobia bacterium GWA2_64_40]OGR61879.1 MAG: UV damage repair endonuclease UvsE [Elusimicrobia bacterium GWB2_63_16]HAU90647.1 UV DNA damage repair endonuclease UvsE [Elusimicrobiota bacterium]
MIRLGLCCKFNEEPIKFRTATATHLLTLTPAARAEKLAGICRDNAAALRAALDFCSANGIGSFRVNSQLLPLKTHPRAGYDLKALPGGTATVSAFKACGRRAKSLGLRLTFHPDQFVLLSSPAAGVTNASLLELEYQAEAAEWTGADVINIHGGGAYGDKPAALRRLAAALKRLSRRARARLALENDDRTYSPADLLPFCREHALPFVYDVHHHRCLPDGLTVEEATRQALATWGAREPLFHLSSPRDGWKGSDPRPHHDYIDIKDFPACWRKLSITIEVEAKAKETAIARLRKDLSI